jgi:hypothetical protein
MTANYLLDAVDRLTLKHVTRVLQTKKVDHTDEEGNVIDSIDVACISDVDHDPLLQQLRDAVAGGTSGHWSSSQARERIPLNSGAMEMFDAIARKINIWYLAVPNPREDRYIWDRLRDWYIDYENRRRAGKVTETVEISTLKLVEGWARNIEAMFDPPTVFEITEVVDREGVKRNAPVACPICGNPKAYDPRNGDLIAALVIEYRNLGVDTIDKATGLCRSCETVWRGGSGIRELRWAIDHTDDTLTA